MQKPRGRVIYKQESVRSVIYQKLRLVKECGNKVGKVSGAGSIEDNEVQVYSQGHIREWRPPTSPLDNLVAISCLCIPTYFDNKQDTPVI